MLNGLPSREDQENVEKEIREGRVDLDLVFGDHAKNERAGQRTRRPGGDVLIIRAEGAVAACPLFQVEGGGAIPTSALQLKIKRCDVKLAVRLNRQWHSRLPEIGNWQRCAAFSAEYEEFIFAIAMWSSPTARLFNGLGYYELRRMAVCDDAPKNTASRFLAVMTRMIKKENPAFFKLISYQDTEVHTGTIYKAAGWKAASDKPRARTWTWRPGRTNQSVAPRIRWELAI